MPDYSKAVIYTIRTKDGLYVGSTTNFTKRKYQHKIKIQTSDENLYKNIRDNDGEWDMKPYKEFSCETKQQLNIEEERIRCELNANLNMNNCYGLNNKKISKRKHEYYTNNKDELIGKRKTYYHDNRNKILNYKKDYYANNKEKIQEYNKKYYQRNKN